MASIVSEVIKDVILEANSKKIVLTPDNYHMLFCEAARRRGVSVEDCKKLEKYISKLDKMYQDELKKMNVRNLDELFAFISSRLNRINPSDFTKLTQAFTLLTKRILQSISLLHNKQARNLANISVQTIDKKISIENINIIKDKWFNFLSDYNDDYLKKLEQYGIKNSDDLEGIVSKLLNAKFTPSSDDKDYTKLAELMIAALVPSIASSMNDELAAISDEIRAKPELLQSDGMQSDIKKFILKRVDLDKSEVKQKIVILDRILDDINEQIKYFISRVAQNENGISSIKTDLDNIRSNDDYIVVKEKLLHVSNSLEFEIKDFLAKLIENKKTISNLKARVKELEDMLLQAKEEISSDYLTNVGTKRAFEIELANIEDVYKRYKIDYSICFFDIDHFKIVNDNYGHEAGDTILSTVGKILKKQSRDIDFVGRYGGEEFVVIMPETSKDNAILFAKNILSNISNFKFLYKGEDIDITISCGVASRKDSKSDRDTLERADSHLYEAKNSGRNCVRPSV
ncbi:GGDEF domain-containing protein [Campylobacter fetus]|uniref:GGDEF domain-containing protein n=1 Tax=Campylobacter fetus TaxID=196 RepID=UPI000FCC38E3|nr:GGDEF domain-containing protein [Campylobacter fetus]RUT51112.1 hypothetical protein BWK67_00915 [Campylobacter fetus]RUT51839.1 hypothetical protein BWK51_00915 [Campylobacter fetus]